MQQNFASKRKRHFLLRRLDLGVKYSALNLVPAGWFCAVGHSVYWLVWTYVFPFYYDSLFLRFSSALLFASFLFLSVSELQNNSRVKLYIVFVMSYGLPFIFTYLLLKNDFSALWPASHAGMILFVFILMQEAIWSLIILFFGIIFAVLIFWLENGSAVPLVFPLFPEYLVVFSFIVSIGVVFSEMSRRGIVEHETAAVFNAQRAETYRALSGSIAHEVRNPVSAAGQALVLIDGQIDRMIKQAKEGDVAGLIAKLGRLSDVTGMAQENLQRGDGVINLILANIRDQNIEPGSLKNESVSSVVDEALREYSFREDERSSVEVMQGDDFQARVDASLLIYVLFNLLKNALHYLPVKPDSHIRIRLNNGGEFNTLHFRDTGPGIPPDRMGTLFDTFSTAGKKGGTGLGLAFCKRVMRAFGGDIRCTSVFGEYTEFTLSFPRVLAEPSAKGPKDA